LAARDFYKLDNSDVLVVCDDFNLPLGKLRCRPQGSAGGQKGLADVIRVLGTEEVPRLRVGIGEAPPGWNAADFVLARFTKQDQPIVDEAVVRASEGVETWVRHGIQKCMNEFN
jgi:PTH1 family peptidyl-tRNA hydrolase